MLETNTSKGKTSVSYYDILQVAQNATDAEIQLAYRKLAKLFHPDRNPDERRLAELRFKLINQAYENLKTKEKRLAYQRQLNKKQKPSWMKKADNDNTTPKPNAPKRDGWFSNFARLFWGEKVEM